MEASSAAKFKNQRTHEEESMEWKRAEQSRVAVHSSVSHPHNPQAKARLLSVKSQVQGAHSGHAEGRSRLAGAALALHPAGPGRGGVLGLGLDRGRGGGWKGACDRARIPCRSGDRDLCPGLRESALPSPIGAGC